MESYHEMMETPEIMMGEVQPDRLRMDGLVQVEVTQQLILAL